MYQSQLFAKTKKEVPKKAEVISYNLLARADFIEQTISGVYRFLPLGFKVLKKITEIIRKEMQNLGGQEVYLPTLQDKKLWLETNRWQTIDPPLFKLRDRHKKETALGSTHEEEITDIVRKRVKSYQDLPLYLFQIQDKFRNEMRVSGGLLRTKEFSMKDLYSFHTTEKDLINFYNKVKKSYFKIFKKCALSALCVQASSGSIGGELSQEFMVTTEVGEDTVLICKKCAFAANIEKIGKAKKCPKCKSVLDKKRAIEIGHIFNLGTKYSKALKANFIDKNGRIQPIVMGCYGIGLPRLMAAVVEISHDEKGIIWPKTITPFDVHLIQIENTKKVKESSEKTYRDLQKAGIEVLYDDRKAKTPGEKFADADLIGIPLRIVVSERTLKQNCLELKQREKTKIQLVRLSKVEPWKIKLWPSKVEPWKRGFQGRTLEG